MSCQYLIAGPCSVESLQQLKSVVDRLMSVPEVSHIRCGVWKPRTRPGGFEGMGEAALQWMAQVRQELRVDKPFACEVARPEHVELALRYGVSTLWIGARTTANPFMVQELSEALRGTNSTVMVKNAPNPDVRLWIGAIERCKQAGIDAVVAIHRGFDVLQNAGYRNNPLWEVPIELRRAMPEVPLVCDPSHIAGKREPLRPLSQVALDLGFDGLMLEVHPCPDQALTDADQQLTPDQLMDVIRMLVWRSTDSSVADRELQMLRTQIDCLDEQLMQVLARRLSVASQIAQVKQRGNLAVFQPKRWDTVLQRRMEEASVLGLDPDFVKRLFEVIHSESVRVQQQLLDDK